VPSGQWRHHLYHVGVSYAPLAILLALWMGVSLFVFLLALGSGALTGLWLFFVPLIIATLVVLLFRRRTVSRILIGAGCALLLAPSIGSVAVPFAIFEIQWGQVIFRLGNTEVSWGWSMMLLDLLVTITLYFFVVRHMFAFASGWRREHESNFPEKAP
tara:strand:- start:3551 stop:4024 length:474 start_codon:yes stop_codon:yes gene_type:complete